MPAGSNTSRNDSNTSNDDSDDCCPTSHNDGNPSNHSGYNSYSYPGAYGRKLPASVGHSLHRNNPVKDAGPCRQITAQASVASKFVV
jgi:hypothetical protein